MTRQPLSGWGLLVGAGLVFAGCGQTNAPAAPVGSPESKPAGAAAASAVASPSSAAASVAGQQPGVIKIGISQPISGQGGSYFDRQLVKPALMAVEDMNAKGGIRGSKIETVLEDNKADAVTAAAIARKLVNVDGVSAISMSITPATLATIPIAEPKKVLVIAAAQSPEVTKSRWAIQDRPNSDRQGDAYVQYNKEVWKASTAGYIAQTDNDAVRVAVDRFKSGFEQAGGKLVAETSFTGKEEDFRSQLAKLKAANPELVIITSPAARPYGLILKQAAEMGFKPKIWAGDDQVTDAEVKQIAGNLSDGFYYVTIPVDRAFSERFNQKFGYPPDGFGVASYDGLMIYLQARLKAGTDDPEKVRDTLYSFSDYKGAMGIWGYKGNGVPQIKLALKIVKDGKGTDL